MIAKRVGLGIVGLGGALVVAAIGLAILAILGTWTITWWQVPPASATSVQMIVASNISFALWVAGVGLVVALLGLLAWPLLAWLLRVIPKRKPKPAVVEGQEIAQSSGALPAFGLSDAHGEKVGFGRSRLMNWIWGILGVLAVLLPFVTMLYELLKADMFAAILVAVLSITLLIVMLVAWFRGTDTGTPVAE